MGSAITLARGLGVAPEEGAQGASGHLPVESQAAMHPGDSTAAESVGENSLMRSVDRDLEGAVTSPGAHCSVNVGHVDPSGLDKLGQGNKHLPNCMLRAESGGHGWGR